MKNGQCQPVKDQITWAVYFQTCLTPTFDAVKPSWESVIVKVSSLKKHFWACPVCYIKNRHHITCPKEHVITSFKAASPVWSYWYLCSNSQHWTVISVQQFSTEQWYLCNNSPLNSDKYAVNVLNKQSLSSAVSI